MMQQRQRHQLVSTLQRGCSLLGFLFLSILVVVPLLTSSSSSTSSTSTTTTTSSSSSSSSTTSHSSFFLVQAWSLLPSDRTNSWHDFASSSSLSSRRRRQQRQQQPQQPQQQHLYPNQNYNNHHPIHDHTCQYCGDVLGSTWTEYEHAKYHRSCYERYIQIKCDVCGEALDGSGGRTWCVTDPWGHTAHAEPCGAVSCSSCQRIVSPATSRGGGPVGGRGSSGGNNGEDGRIICGHCQATAVTTSAHIQSALTTVWNLLQHQQRGILRPGDIRGPIQVHLATRQALTQKAHHVGCAHGNFHGLTTTTRITSAFLQTGGGTSNSAGAAAATMAAPNAPLLPPPQLLQQQQQQQPTTYTTMEHEITLLTGLPRLQFCGVLAHELLHVWLNEANLQPPTQLMEGFCNLGSHIVYTTAAAAGGGGSRNDLGNHHHGRLRRYNNNENNNNPNRRRLALPNDDDSTAALATVLLQQMQQDPDPVYGDGYRIMKQIYERQGWDGVLRKISSYQRRS